MPPNPEVVVGDVVSLAAGVGTDSACPSKVLEITYAVDQRVPNEEQIRMSVGSLSAPTVMSACGLATTN